MLWRGSARLGGVSGVDFNVLGNPAELIRKLKVNTDTQPHGIQKAKGPALLPGYIGRSHVGEQDYNGYSQKSYLHWGFGAGPPPGEKLQGTPD